MESLLDTLKWSVIVGILALGLALLRPIMEKRYSARWRYWAWLALAVLALLAPVQWEKLLPGVPAAAAPVVIDVPQMSVYVSRETGISFEPPTPLESSPDVPKDGGARTVELWKVLPAIWLGGAAVFALYHLLGIRVFRRKALRWSRRASEETLDIYDAVQQEMELEKVPPLRVSSAVGSPMLLGVLRPCLLLPGEEWSDWELAFILRHELTHYRRHDLWYKLVLLAANAVHWFNPLLYLMVREAGADMELTCDDRVVAGLDREARRAYSETLLSAIHQEKGAVSALSTHFYGGREVMKERFRNILTRRRRKWGVLILVLTLLATVFFACAFGLRQAEPEIQRTEDRVDLPDDSAMVQPESSMGSTESFVYNGLRLTVTNVRETGQGSASTDMGETFPYTIYTCYPGAQASVIHADMEDGTYSEDGLPHADWAFDLASGGHIDITDDTGPIEITADTLGVYNKEASLYVLRFEMYNGQDEPVQSAQGEEPEIIEPEVTEPSSVSVAMAQYRAVLLENASFLHVDGAVRQELTLANIKQAVTDDEEITVSVPRFTVVDLDHDGEEELVLWLRVNDVNDIGSVVLHSINGQIYGYTLFTRQFNDVKTDGTFLWSGSASDNGVGTLAFTETGYTMNEAGALGDTDVTWYAFTDNNMARIFG